MTEDMLEFVQLVMEWHQGKMDQLGLVIEKKDASIVIGDMTIEAGTELHRGIIMGFMLAKEQVSELPFSLSKKD